MLNQVNNRGSVLCVRMPQLHAIQMPYPSTNEEYYQIIIGRIGAKIFDSKVVASLIQCSVSPLPLDYVLGLSTLLTSLAPRKLRMLGWKAL